MAADGPRTPIVVVSMKSQATGPDEARPGGGQTPSNTPLARLCRYYLDCLRHDDVGAGYLLGASDDGGPHYVELQTLINPQGRDPLDSDAGRRLLAHVIRDGDRGALVLGYPVRVRTIGSRASRGAFLAEPLLLFPFGQRDGRQGPRAPTDQPPRINVRALRGLSNGGGATLVEEASQLAEDLGLGHTVRRPPGLDELIATLCRVRPGWDWREAIDPRALSGGKPLAALNRQGIFNRAILTTLPSAGSPYTKGLEFELQALQAVGEDAYQATALGAWMSARTIDSASAEQPPLLEVVPLNNEQRQAVRQGLANPLTVITGPPGTGKSQVVISIVVNAARQGMTVLFASKNNNAVDLVEARVNSLGPRPVLLRVGADERRLAEHAASLLAEKASPDDHDRYREYETIHARLRRRSESLEAEREAVISLRNEVDRLEQQAEALRLEIGEAAFRRLQAVDRRELRHLARLFQGAVGQTSEDGQPIWIRLLWPLVRKRRFERLAEARERLQRMLHGTGLLTWERHESLETLDRWRQRDRLSFRVSQVLASSLYFAKLAALTEARSLEELTRDWTKLAGDLVDYSRLVWETWLRLQPSRVGRAQRKALGDYSAVVQMIASTVRNSRPARALFRQYYQLFQQITSVVGCWAVTSLSVRGRVPFAPNLFDVLVIDEASQCDIASALPLLYRARRVVVIGDPMQLRHISILSTREDHELLSQHELMDEYSSWAYSARSLFDLANSRCRSEDVVVLREHHRSHADIIEFSNNAFYGGGLRVATNYDRLRQPHLDEPAVRWVDVRGATVRPAKGGAINEVEAQAVVGEIERLVSGGYSGTIGVVSPFRAQADRIKDLVHERESLVARLTGLGFLADTVHRFQGDERDVMIFSPVVSPGVSDAAIGFLRHNPNLFNVAVSRARAALVVVGNKEAALSCGVDYLARFAVYAGQLAREHQPVTGALGSDLGPEYPVVSRPDRVSDWERVFYRALHRAGVHLIPRYRVEKYVLDFALLGPQGRLAIEIDSEMYHRMWDTETSRRDQIRHQRLMELGWDAMRFWVYQVRDDLDHCVERVKRWLEFPSTR
jgi:very-short-patch-repair endonuclease